MTRPVRRTVRVVQMFAMLASHVAGLSNATRVGGVGCIRLLSQGQITASLHPRLRIMFTGCRVTTVLRANHLVRDNIKCYQPLYLLARYLPCWGAGCAALYPT